MDPVLSWWRNLSILKKFYAVIGVMAILIAAELATLHLAMDTLSAVRAFVAGEGRWSKAQKDAVFDLLQYALTADSKYYDSYLAKLRVQLGDREARIELEKTDWDLEKVRAGLAAGGIPDRDIEKVARFFRRFENNSYIKRARDIWQQGDDHILLLTQEASRLRALVTSPRGQAKQIHATLQRIEDLNGRLTRLEDQFSDTLSEATGWLEGVVMFTLTAAVLTVGGLSLYMTFSFSRHLSLDLRDMNDAAKAIGAGDFDRRIPVRSRDELGRLALSLNQMAKELAESLGEKLQAKEASRWKSLFVANMSHEIRTPLGAIMGFVELLKDPGLSPQERDRYLEIASRTCENLSKLINDILDLSKVEAGHLDIQKSVFSSGLFIEDLHGLLEIKARAKGVELRFEPEGKIPEVLNTDPVRLRQILVNLISNAIKFTPSGGKVRVRYRARGRELRFEVRDSGEGIPLEQQSRLFKPFSQASAAVTTQFGGTGLGLYLSRSLARAMGGDVWLENSRPGEGAVFAVRVALESPSRKGMETSAASPRAGGSVAQAANLKLDGVRVLLVEDTMENQILFQRILTRQGAKVEIAHNGEEGVRAAMDGKFDLVLMDMQMPTMDGHEATRELRRLGFAPPIVALTAQAMKEDRLRCLSDGCSGYLAKPVTKDALIKTVYEFSLAARAGAPRGHAKPGPLRETMA